MTQGKDPSIVIAFYRNPQTGRTEKHELPSIVYEEASKGRMVENKWVTPADADAWSREAPEDVAPHEIDDRTPKSMESVTRPAQPPPAVATRSPQPLPGREAAPVPPVPARSRR